MNPFEVADLAAQAIEARLVRDEDRVLEVLQTVLVNGGPGDALTFVLFCLYTIRCGLIPGMPAVIGPVQVFGDGMVGPTPGVSVVGQRLFAEMLTDYLAGGQSNLRLLWNGADNMEASGAVNVALGSAAKLVRNRRARLN